MERRAGRQCALVPEFLHLQRALRHLSGRPVRAAAISRARHRQGADGASGAALRRTGLGAFRMVGARLEHAFDRILSVDRRAAQGRVDHLPRQRRGAIQARAERHLMQTVLIAAVAENGTIGRGGGMPWRLKSDMRRFRALTLDRPVVMGRKTYLSLSIKPLPRRTSIVVSRDPAFTAPGVIAASNLAAALQAAHGDALRRGSDAIMVIGGADLYAQTMRLANRLEITQIHTAPQGDTRFPAIDPTVWRESARESCSAGPDDDAPCDFVTYLKRDA